MAQWFKITCRCTSCGHRWSFKTKNPDAPDPPCPRPVRYDDGGEVAETCGTQLVPIGMDLSLNKAPAAIGGNVHNKAIDETAQIVMQDYGMTDLRDDVRPTETMTPKLPPQQQAMADAYFGGPKGGNRRRMGFNPALHVARAMGGGLTDSVSTDRSIGVTHRQQVRPPVHIVNQGAR